MVRSGCPWCKRVPDCADRHTDTDDVCDFKSLPWEKDAIFVRMGTEYDKVKELRELAKEEKDPERLNKIIAEMMDKTEGMRIMQEALTKEFGAKPREFKERLNIEDMSLADKMKLMMKLQSFNNQRRSKK